MFSDFPCHWLTGCRSSVFCRFSYHSLVKTIQSVHDLPDLFRLVVVVAIISSLTAFSIHSTLILFGVTQRCPIIGIQTSDVLSIPSIVFMHTMSNIILSTGNNILTYSRHNVIVAVLKRNFTRQHY